jgi:hypothetical protein
MQVLDPTNGQLIWNRVDERIEGDDMFVALEETNGHLFWCTNHGYYGFITLSTALASNLDQSLESTKPIPIEASADLVRSLSCVCTKIPKEARRPNIKS